MNIHAIAVVVFGVWLAFTTLGLAKIKIQNWMQNRGMRL